MQWRPHKCEKAAKVGRGAGMSIRCSDYTENEREKLTNLSRWKGRRRLGRRRRSRKRGSGEPSCEKYRKAGKVIMRDDRQSRRRSSENGERQRAHGQCSANEGRLRAVHAQQHNCPDAYRADMRPHPEVLANALKDPILGGSDGHELRGQGGTEDAKTHGSTREKDRKGKRKMEKENRAAADALESQGRETNKNTGRRRIHSQ
ncbi:hypothetical protein B0H14DRAFT_2583757 [Mycena olivaceomarginata]|nr:hypothetical protein B0H14DRAFT_2583757 [Mycena olivaceomarginata]